MDKKGFMRKVICIIANLAFVSMMAEAQVVTSCPDNNHPHMIDLGLDDGTLWACCNVGATSPEEYGHYFAWGETSPKDFYYWDSYKWCEGSANSLTKYNYDANNGTVDNKLELDLEDDAAYVNWGNNWCTPSIDQVRFLSSGTVREQAVVNGVKGFILKGKNGNAIFMADAGSVKYECTFEENRSYWTRTLDFYEGERSSSSNAIKFNWTDDGSRMTCYYPRWLGYPVRPVALVPRTSKVILNAENFPDANFRKALAERYNVSNDGNSEITAEQIAATSILNLSHKNISNFEGIRYFTELTRLYCDNNQLTSIDVSNQPKLLELNISNNQLTSLNVSSNPYLVTLACSNNQLTSLDVSKNTILSSLDCSENQLPSLDLSRNTDLDYVYCSNNQLSSLNVYNCRHLRILHCFGNKLTTLTGLRDRYLTTLHCYSNQIQGAAMDALVNSLWKNQWGNQFVVVDTKDKNEANVCTNAQVAIAKERGWSVCDYNGGDICDYDGFNHSGVNNIIGEAKGIDTYYMIDGRKLDGKPRHKGMFINNGHKIIVK